MWNNQDFDQSGFGQGGGFSTPQADDKKRNVKRSNNIVPVTISQILTAKEEEDILVTGNIELSQVTLVGVIKSVSASATRIDYTIDDMTGPPIDAKHFNARDDGDQEESNDSSNSALPVNTYVRINGRVRSFGGKRSVNIHKVEALTDMNELSCHLLEVIYAVAKSADQQNQIAPTTGGYSKGMDSMDTGNAGQTAGLNPLQNQIYNIIKSNQSDAGCSIDEICQNLRSAAPKAIRDAVDFLSMEGHVYSTIDEEHYQATDL